MTGAARLLGVHPNTIRAWTDQGRLRCLRINERGDRRYRVADLQEFLQEAGIQTAPFPFASRVRPEPANAPASVRRVPLPEPTPLPAASNGHGAQSPVRTGQGLATITKLGLPNVRSEEPGPASPRTPGAQDNADGVRTLVDQIRHQVRGQLPLAEGLRDIARSLLETQNFRTVGIGQWQDQRLSSLAVEGVDAPPDWLEGADPNLVAVCLREGRPVAVPTGARPDTRGRRPPSTVTVYSPVGPVDHPWGVLMVESASDRPLSRQDLDLLDSAAAAAEAMAGQAEMNSRIANQQRRADGLARVTARLNSELEQPVVMRMLVEDCLSLFDADRAALWRFADGDSTADASINISARYVDAVREYRRATPQPPIPDTTDAVVLHDAADQPSMAPLREAILEEGFRTVGYAPLMANGERLGVLGVYHDTPYAWTADDRNLLMALSTQAAVALRNAKNYQLMATWAAQLQSIQQLGTRLNRWGTVAGIGQAIAAELRQLIDYHNVRVYRVAGDMVEPVAWRGEIGEYTDEEREQLRLKVGEGITGWVAQNGIPQYLPDAAHDPRSSTIPGTEEDLDESMLIAPMLYEDRVIGVIVLSKLGLNQFTGDDLRYLEIYASIAAQAMVNADSTEQLRAQSDKLANQLTSQRELMLVTESILSNLDPRIVVEEIADRLGGLLKVDNIAIGIHDPQAGVVRTLFARGADAEMYMNIVIKDTEGVAGWVIRNGEAVLIPNTLTDERFIKFGDRPVRGAVIAAPLRSRDRVTGNLLLERLGEDAAFTEDEFELLQLFAGHVSIALQNAEAHQAVEIRAQTDMLTNLKNQGTFQEYLERQVNRGNPFSLLIVDLDDFKGFNDQRGHEAGNALLAGIASALRASCRDSDEVFRYGGDEFALILPNTDVVGGLEVAAKVGRAVKNVPIPGSKRASNVTCSIGVATFPGDGEDRESLLLSADRACYVAKRGGRNRAVTAVEALALAGDVLPEGPTPVDDPELTADAA